MRPSSQWVTPRMSTAASSDITASTSSRRAPSSAAPAMNQERTPAGMAASQPKWIERAPSPRVPRRTKASSAVMRSAVSRPSRSAMVSAARNSTQVPALALLGVVEQQPYLGRQSGDRAGAWTVAVDGSSQGEEGGLDATGEVGIAGAQGGLVRLDALQVRGDGQVARAPAVGRRDQRLEVAARDGEGAAGRGEGHGAAEVGDDGGAVGGRRQLGRQARVELPVAELGEAGQRRGEARAGEQRRGAVGLGGGRVAERDDVVGLERSDAGSVSNAAMPVSLTPNVMVWNASDGRRASCARRRGTRPGAGRGARPPRCRRARRRRGSARRRSGTATRRAPTTAARAGRARGRNRSPGPCG